jgi:hypothetical protein
MEQARNESVPTPYYVYVIELSDEAGARIDPSKPCVYVGQSARTPDERFQQHRSGYRAAAKPRKYGKYLRRRLFAKYNPLPSREAAEQMEAQLAEQLREQGYRVFGGH